MVIRNLKTIYSILENVCENLFSKNQLFLFALSVLGSNLLLSVNDIFFSLVSCFEVSGWEANLSAEGQRFLEIFFMRLVLQKNMTL